jgi:hypothetical protein
VIEMASPPPGREPSFWNEIYWFLAIGLIGWTLAALVLSPRIAGTRQLLEKERRVVADLKGLQEEENVLEGAVSAMENDPYYQEAVIRTRLGLKKKNEEYLELPPPPAR